MKVAVALCLLACVAVSQAAFTAPNLVQRAQPLLNQAMFKARLTSRSANPALQTELFQGLQNHANTLLAQINSGIEMGQEMITSIQTAYEDILVQISQLQDSVAGTVGGILSSVINEVTNIWSNITSFFGPRSSEKRWLGGLVESLFGEHIATIQGVLHNLGMAAALQELINEHLPSWAADWIMENIINRPSASNLKFWSNITSVIGGVASGLWNQVTEIAQNLAANAAAQFQSIQNLAQNALNQMLGEGSVIASDALNNILALLRPHAADLGALWTQIEAQAQGIVSQISGLAKTH